MAKATLHRLERLEHTEHKRAGVGLQVYLYDQSGAYWQSDTNKVRIYYTEQEIEQRAGGHKVILIPDNGRG